MIKSLAAFTIFIQVTSQFNLNFTNNGPFKSLFHRSFPLFDVWLDCKERMPVLFYYVAVRDVGSLSRSSTFQLDPTVSVECQQLSSSPYSGSGYDRGHMVPANHIDHSQQAIIESNYMTNINPQYFTLNRGAWLQSEEIVECLRDVHTLKVYGGVIMGNNETNDIFLKTHGIRTPDFFWKIIENTRTKETIAWIMPNDDTATRSNLNTFLTTIKDIEDKSGFSLNNFTSSQKKFKQLDSWDIPKGCDDSK